MGKTKSSVPAEGIEQAILLIRGKKVMLDVDLAALYEVETGVLNRAVKRNVDRFPEDFMFQLTLEETERLRCQFGISKHGSRFDAFLNKSIFQVRSLYLYFLSFFRTNVPLFMLVPFNAIIMS